MKITIIGAGNLGGAIACGLARGALVSANDITLVDSNPAALEKVRETGLPFRLTSELRKAIPSADILVLAVKSHVAKDVIASGAGLWDYKRQIFFSVVAGMSFEELDQLMVVGAGNDDGRKHEPVMFRIMPNIAIAIGESMTFISARNANAAQTKFAETIFGEMGQTMIVPERLMPAAMAVGSCGIAYAMRYVRAAMNGAIEVGFSAPESRMMVLQTIKGAVDLLLNGGQHPEVEIDRVITPGGYTIKGLNAMEKNGFSSSIAAGIRESCKNSK